MARDGSGSYNLPAGNPVVTGTTISSTWANATMPDIGTALTNSISKDGQTTPTANLPMGGNRHTGVSDGNLGTQYSSINQTQNGSLVKVGSVANATDAFTGSIAPAIASYTDGLIITMTPTVTNTTTTVTLALNGLTVKPIQKEGGVALAIGDIVLNVPVHLQYTTQGGGYWMLLNPQKVTGARVIALPDSSLSSNVPLKNTANVFGGSAGVAITVNGVANQNCVTLLGPVTSGQSFGLSIAAGTTSADYGLQIANQANTVVRFQVRGDGVINVGNTTDNAAVNFNGTGPVTVGGALTANGVATLNAAAAGTISLTINGVAAGQSILAFNTNAVQKAVIATAGAANDIVTGSVAGDLTLRTVSTAINFSVNNGSSVNVKVTSGGQLQAIDETGTLRDVGFRGIPQTATSVNYTTVISDRGKHILLNGAVNATITIASNASVPYPVESTITFCTGLGGAIMTIAIAGGDTLVFSANNTTGSRTLGTGGMATALKVAPTIWYINGGGLT